MAERPEEGLVGDVLEAVGGKRGAVRLEGMKRTADGVRYERGELRGGCLIGVAFGIVVPFLVWVYPGARHDPVLNGVIATITLLAWMLLVGDVTRKVVVTAEAGHLWVERRMFGLGRRREVKLEGHGLVVYEAASNAMMASYGVRAAHGRGDLGVRLERREAEMLVAVLEEAVWPGGKGRPVETPRLAE